MASNIVQYILDLKTKKAQAGLEGVSKKSKQLTSGLKVMAGAVLGVGGSGGGGGGSTWNAAGTDGGAGGQDGGGGGGGSAAPNGSASGAGGVGGNGYCVVIAWA